MTDELEVNAVAMITEVGNRDAPDQLRAFGRTLPYWPSAIRLNGKRYVRDNVEVNDDGSEHGFYVLSEAEATG